MEKMNLNDTISEFERENPQSNGDFFKAKEGANKLRVLTNFISYTSHFKVGACLGKDKCPDCKKDPETKPSTKFMCYVYDYSDKKIKLAQLSYTVAKSIQTLQNDPDYSFETAPMPYDIKLNADGAGTKEVTYTVTPSPKREDMPKEVIDMLVKMKPITEVKDAFKNKRMKTLGLVTDNGKPKVADTDIDYPENDVDVNF